MTFTSSDPGQSFGATGDRGDATYTATVTATQSLVFGRRRLVVPTARTVRLTLSPTRLGRLAPRVRRRQGLTAKVNLYVTWSPAAGRPRTVRTRFALPRPRARSVRPSPRMAPMPTRR